MEYEYIIYNQIINLVVYADAKEITIPTYIDHYKVISIEYIGIHYDESNEIDCPLEYITIPQTIEKIDAEEFNDCNNLKAIYVDNNPYYESINGVLYNKDCTYLIKYPSHKDQYIIKDTVVIIYDYAFYLCLDLKEIILPYSVKEIGKKAFVCCGHLHDIALPSRIQVIEEKVFPECYELEKIVFNDNLIEIKDQGFSHCRKLEYIPLPKNLKYIVVEAFYKCISLKSIDIPNSVQFIGDYAFSLCGCLESIHLPNTEYISDAMFFLL